jgi:hypothetical protein
VSLLDNAAVPLAGDDEDTFWFEGKPKPETDNDLSWSISYVVEEDYLKVMGMPLERGRFFTAQDNENSSHVVVVDDVFAQKYFPEKDPIGQHIFLTGKNGRAEIIGIVPHVKQWGLDSDDKESLRAELYFPYSNFRTSYEAIVEWHRRHAAFPIKCCRDCRFAEAAIKGWQAHVMSRTQTMDSIIDSLCVAAIFMAGWGFTCSRWPLPPLHLRVISYRGQRVQESAFALRWAQTVAMSADGAWQS